MTELQEVTDFFEPSLLIPVGEKTYKIRPLTADNVAFILKAREAVAKAEKDGVDPSTIKVEGVDENETQADTQRRVFGDTYDELIADGVSAIGMFRMTQVIMIWTLSGIEEAKAFVATGGKALTVPQNRAERRTATRTRTAAANTTKARASRSGTSTPKATAKAAEAGPKS